jgi:hypothetical protein
MDTVNIKFSLNHTLPISLYCSEHKVLKSYVKSSQADILCSFVLLKFTAYSVLIQFTAPLLKFRNSARLYRRGMGTHHRKHMSCDHYPLLLCNITALHSNDLIRGKKNTAPVLLASHVLRALPINSFTYRNIKVL